MFWGSLPPASAPSVLSPSQQRCLPGASPLAGAIPVFPMIPCPKPFAFYGQEQHVWSFPGCKIIRGPAPGPERSCRGQAGRAIWGVLSSRGRDGMFPRALRGAGSREPARRSSLGSGDRGQPGNGNRRLPAAGSSSLGQAGPHVDTNSTGHRDRIQDILQQRHRARTATCRARSPRDAGDTQLSPVLPAWLGAGPV